jgi:ATP-dependent protease Clp ATPase subunit
MFDLPSLVDVDEVVVNEEAASNCGIPLLIYAKKINEESASA